MTPPLSVAGRSVDPGLAGLLGRRAPRSKQPFVVTFFRASPGHGPIRAPRAARPLRRRLLKKTNELPQPHRLPGIFGESGPAGGGRALWPSRGATLQPPPGTPPAQAPVDGHALPLRPPCPWSPLCASPAPQASRAPSEPGALPPGSAPCGLPPRLPAGRTVVWGKVSHQARPSESEGRASPAVCLFLSWESAPCLAST